MIGIVLEGKLAVEEHQRLLDDGKEIPVALRERDATGRKRTTRIQFGINADTAWVYSQDEKEGMEPQMILEAVLTHEAQELFQGYLERMELRRGLVDPSPLSSALVVIEPEIQAVLEGLNTELGIEVNLT